MIETNIPLQDGNNIESFYLIVTLHLQMQVIERGIDYSLLYPQ